MIVGMRLNRDVASGVSSTIVTTVMPTVPNLRKLRIEAALSQRELAEASGVTQGTISRLEQGDTNVQPSTLRKLAAALGVKPKELFA